VGDGGARAAPYAAARALIDWLREPGVWHELDGIWAGHGVDPLALRFDRFLNMIYAEMAQRVYDAKGNSHRAEVDAAFGVAAWDTPFGSRYRIDRPDGAPAWWAGDEEASQGFLRAMGVGLS
jgi:hypothetical protein